MPDFIQRPAPDPGRAAGRLTGLDQARALAILAMILFHFAPGAFAHAPALEPVREPVLWFGRTATPAFVTVFGLTIGFALLPRYLRGEGSSIPARLRRRAVVVLGAALVVGVPVVARLAGSGGKPDWSWVFAVYSVLVFYALALAVLPVWLVWLRPSPVARALLGGLGLWFVGTLGYEAWPAGPLGGPEFVRMTLVSGGYGYCQMMGTALLAVPLGLYLRRALDAGVDRPFLVRLLGVGLALSAVGAGWGLAAGEYDLERVLSGDLRIPARGWYFLHFGALSIVALAGLDLLTRDARWFRPVGYVLALFGQTALVIYTGHVFILPALDLFDEFRPVAVRGVWRLAEALVLFGLLSGLVLYARHRRLAGSAARPVYESRAVQDESDDLSDDAGPVEPSRRSTVVRLLGLR